MRLKGSLTNKNTVLTKEGTEFQLPIRGEDEVLIDATLVGGSGTFKRQCVKPFVGLEVEFSTNDNVNGYNFKILPD